MTLFPHSADCALTGSRGRTILFFSGIPHLTLPTAARTASDPRAEHATSNVATIFLGYQLTHTTEFFADVETTEGGGLSDALGLAGFVNLDVVRNPELGPSPYSGASHDSPDHSSQLGDDGD